MSVGSLTTTFTPPASCLASFSTTIDSSGLLVAGPATTQGCMPENFQFSSTNFYSPGICPVGYTTACRQLNVIGTISETVVTCCPTSYVCVTNPSLTQQMTFGCQSAFNSAAFPSLVIVSGTTPMSTLLTTQSGGAVNAFSVQIRYQSTDFQSSQAASTSTMSSSTSMTIITSISPLSMTTSASISSSGGATSGGGGEISPGAAAGIGVGCAVGVLLLAGAFVFVYALGRRRRLAENSSVTYVLPDKSNIVSMNTGAQVVSEHAVPMPEMPGL